MNWKMKWKCGAKHDAKLSRDAEPDTKNVNQWI